MRQKAERLEERKIERFRKAMERGRMQEEECRLRYEEETAEEERIAAERAQCFKNEDERAKQARGNQEGFRGSTGKDEEQ